jgi:hypothetical protein
METLSGVLTSFETGAPVPGLTITLGTPTPLTATTNSSGAYSINLAGVATGSYSLMASGTGWQTGSMMISITAGQSATRSGTIQAVSTPSGPTPSPTVTIIAIDADTGTGITADITMTEPGAGTPEGNTPVNIVLPTDIDSYTFTATSIGYQSVTFNIVPSTTAMTMIYTVKMTATTSPNPTPVTVTPVITTTNPGGNFKMPSWAWWVIGIGGAAGLAYALTKKKKGRK